MPRFFRRQDGFTLIELMIVVVIISILAAIALPAFLGQREKANDSDTKSRVRTAYVTLAAYALERDSYDGITVADLVDREGSLSADGTLSLTVDGDSFEVSSRSDNGRVFSIGRDGTAPVGRSCTPDGGGCNGGTW